MMLLQYSIIAWLIGLSVAASSNLVSNQFSRQLVTNFSNYQCQPQPSMCNYFNNYYGAKFVDNHTLLRLGFCATYEEHTRMVSLSVCPYFHPNGKYSIHKEECNMWYIQLPNNVSKLNDYMCGPLNRKGECAVSVRMVLDLQYHHLVFRYSVPIVQLVVGMGYFCTCF